MFFECYSLYVYILIGVAKVLEIKYNVHYFFVFIYYIFVCLFLAFVEAFR